MIFGRKMYDGSQGHRTGIQSLLPSICMTMPPAFMDLLAYKTPWG
jgi:hypothetical protein